MAKATESLDSRKRESASVGPFGLMAVAYAARSIRVIPTGGLDGKKPLIRNWPRVGLRAVPELVRKFPSANIGVIDGHRGGVTRVDIDDPALVDGAIRRFGDSPIKVATPGGGLHLWYRANGERRVIGLDGEKIDVLGLGGFGVAPPSINPGGGEYRFLEGGLDDLDRLPTIRPGVLSSDVYGRARSETRLAKTNSDPFPIHMGTRNDTLFRAALREAKRAESAHHLALRLAIDNEQCELPLPLTEVEKIAHSAWRYEQDGRNWMGQEARAQITVGELEALEGYGDAALLLMHLRAAHGWRDGEEFALANALAASLGWGLLRYRNARNFLTERGFLTLIHPGGKGPHDPPLARLRKGVQIEHQYNITPSLSPCLAGSE